MAFIREISTDGSTVSPPTIATVQQWLILALDAHTYIHYHFYHPSVMAADANQLPFIPNISKAHSTAYYLSQDNTASVNLTQ